MWWEGEMGKGEPRRLSDAQEEGVSVVGGGNATGPPLGYVGTGDACIKLSKEPCREALGQLGHESGFGHTASKCNCPRDG